MLQINFLLLCAECKLGVFQVLILPFYLRRWLHVKLNEVAIAVSTSQLLSSARAGQGSTALIFIIGLPAPVNLHHIANSL